MKLQKMHGPECLAYSLCMCLDVEVEYFYAHIGHNGLEKVFTTIPQERGINIQECIDYALTCGFALIEINKHCATGNGKEEHETYCFPLDRFLNHIMSGDCILIGKTHAYACDGTAVYDPRGYTLFLENVLNDIHTAFLVRRII